MGLSERQTRRLTLISAGLVLVALAGSLGAWQFVDGYHLDFLAMMANAAYREALVHRYAGLERTILLQMQG